MLIDMYAIIDNNTHIFNNHLSKINLNQSIALLLSIASLTLHIRAMEVSLLVDGVDNHSTSPYGLGVPDEVAVLEAPPFNPQTP